MSDLLSKSFLFEIVDIKTSIVDRAFTLIIPPTALSIREPQRVNITKTFRNVHVDDYGADNLEIVIKGFSGTAHVFPTYARKGHKVNSEIVGVRKTQASQASSVLEGYDQRGAFYTFRNDIMRYKDRAEWDKKELRVYDLYDEQGYKCILRDFSLDRHAENPLRYPYTINLMVYQRYDQKPDLGLQAIEISKDPFSALAEIDEALDAIEEGMQFATDILSAISLVRQQAKLVYGRLNLFLNNVGGFVEAPLNTIKQMFEMNMDLLKAVKPAWDTAVITYDQYMSIGEYIHANIANSLAIYGYAIEAGSQASKELTRSVGRSTAPSLDTFSFDSYTTYIVKGQDTFQSIALYVLGDLSLWPHIAEVNSMIDNTDLVVGESIYIPQQADATATSKDAFILSENIIKDPYGVDIRLDTNGNVVVQENNDLALVTGIENLMQAVNTILTTDIGSVLTQSALGLANVLGRAGTDATLSYIRMNIKFALLRDSRIEDVLNIRVVLADTELTLSMDLVVIGYSQIIPITTKI